MQASTAKIFGEVQSRLGEILEAFEVHRVINDAYVEDREGRLVQALDVLYGCMKPVVLGLQMTVFVGVQSLVENKERGNANLRRLLRIVENKAPGSDLSWVKPELDKINGRYERLRHEVFGHNDENRQQSADEFFQSGRGTWESIKNDLAELNYIFKVLCCVQAEVAYPDRSAASSIKHMHDLLVDNARDAAGLLVSSIRHADFPSN